MSIEWKLKSYLAEHHNLYSITHFQKVIEKNTGVTISKMNLGKLVNRKPIMIRLETLEIICSALECESHAFLAVRPKKLNPKNKRKLSFKNTPLTKRATKTFPDPLDYE